MESDNQKGAFGVPKASLLDHRECPAAGIPGFVLACVGDFTPLLVPVSQPHWLVKKKTLSLQPTTIEIYCLVQK